MTVCKTVRIGRLQLEARFDILMKEVEIRIAVAISGDETLAETALILQSIPGISPVASTTLIAEMAELGAITGEKAVVLAALAPVAHHSRPFRRKRAIAGGRRAPRHVMLQAAMVAAHHNPNLTPFASGLRKAGNHARSASVLVLSPPKSIGPSTRRPR